MFVKGVHVSIRGTTWGLVEITLYALKEGCVMFEKDKLTKRKWIHVVPKEGHEVHPVYVNAAAAAAGKTKTAVA